jgi:hypothetical protein
VWLLRIITSCEIKKRADFFAPFVMGLSDLDVSTFCARCVDPMGEEADHVQLVALTDALQVPIRVVYLDRSLAPGGGAAASGSSGVHVDKHDFVPEGGPSTQPRVHLLYRPGHYVCSRRALLCCLQRWRWLRGDCGAGWMQTHSHPPGSSHTGFDVPAARLSACCPGNVFIAFVDPSMVWTSGCGGTSDAGAGARPPPLGSAPLTCVCLPLFFARTANHCPTHDALICASPIPVTQSHKVLLLS